MYHNDKNENEDIGMINNWLLIDRLKDNNNDKNENDNNDKNENEDNNDDDAEDNKNDNKMKILAPHQRLLVGFPFGVFWTNTRSVLSSMRDYFFTF